MKISKTMVFTSAREITAKAHGKYLGMKIKK